MNTRWGVMGAAGIARKMFLPAAAQSASAEVRAIASRSMEKSQALAREFGLAQAYDSYDALLNDLEIDAIYIPLPNAQHVEATERALAAGKHVLCEKPLAMNAEDINRITFAAQAAERMAVEGFMVAYHPQWDQVRKWIADGMIGKIQRIEGCFTYFLDQPENIRNAADGGALRDIGVYPIFTTRWVTGQEPRRALGVRRTDSTADADISTAGWLEFDDFDAEFYVSSRADRTESFIVFGTEGRIEVPKAFNPPDEGPQQIVLYKGNEIAETHTFSDVFQFALQIEHLSQCFAGQGTPRVTLANSQDNQRVLDAVLQSTEEGGWVTCGS